MACCSNMGSLPDDCVSRILSFTSPKDACTMLAVSKDLRNPVESNVVWNKFLPTDYSNILSSLNPVSPLPFSSKKELFFLLSDSVLIDAGSKAFALEKSTGRKSYIISATKLSILYGCEESKWTWKSIQQSRFAKVAELITAERIEIEGKIRSQTLSPNTNYGAYLVFKISDHAFGLHTIPCEVSIALGDRVLTRNTAILRDPNNEKLQLQGLFYGNRVQKMREMVTKGDQRAAQKRQDGWLEIEIGEFFLAADHQTDEDIVMTVMEVKGFQLKGGLIVEGIQVRPKP